MRKKLALACSIPLALLTMSAFGGGVDWSAVYTDLQMSGTSALLDSNESTPGFGQVFPIGAAAGVQSTVYSQSQAWGYLMRNITMKKFIGHKRSGLPFYIKSYAYLAKQSSSSLTDKAGLMGSMINQVNVDYDNPKDRISSSDADQDIIQALIDTLNNWDNLGMAGYSRSDTQQLTLQAIKSFASVGKAHAGGDIYNAKTKQWTLMDDDIGTPLTHPAYFDPTAFAKMIDFVRNNASATDKDQLIANLQLAMKNSMQSLVDLTTKNKGWITDTNVGSSDPAKFGSIAVQSLIRLSQFLLSQDNATNYPVVYKQDKQVLQGLVLNLQANFNLIDGRHDMNEGQFTESLLLAIKALHAIGPLPSQITSSFISQVQADAEKELNTTVAGFGAVETNCYTSKGPLLSTCNYVTSGTYLGLQLGLLAHNLILTIKPLLVHIVIPTHLMPSNVKISFSNIPDASLQKVNAMISIDGAQVQPCSIGSGCSIKVTTGYKHTASVTDIVDSTAKEIDTYHFAAQTSSGDLNPAYVFKFGAPSKVIHKTNIGYTISGADKLNQHQDLKILFKSVSDGSTQTCILPKNTLSTSCIVYNQEKAGAVEKFQVVAPIIPGYILQSAGTTSEIDFTNGQAKPAQATAKYSTILINYLISITSGFSSYSIAAHPAEEVDFKEQKLNVTYPFTVLTDNVAHVYQLPQGTYTVSAKDFHNSTDTYKSTVTPPTVVIPGDSMPAVSVKYAGTPIPAGSVCTAVGIIKPFGAYNPDKPGQYTGFNIIFHVTNTSNKKINSWLLDWDNKSIHGGQVTYDPFGGTGTVAQKGDDVSFNSAAWNGHVDVKQTETNAGGVTIHYNNNQPGVLPEKVTLKCKALS